MPLRYCFHGTAVQIRGEEAAVERAVRDIFRHFGWQAISSSSGDPAVALTVSTAASLSVPSSACEAAHFDIGVKAYRADALLFLRVEGAVAELNPSDGSGQVALSPRLIDQPRRLRTVLMRVLILGVHILLRHHRFYVMHAAALASEKVSMLLVADSDCGKSTLSYSLVREGWQHLSDDAVLLRPTPSHVEALAFRKKFALDTEAEMMFPELASNWDRQFDEESKGTIAVETLHPGQAAEQCVPRVLLFPEIVDQPTSQLREVGKAEAMHAVLRQSALLTLEPELAPAHLDVLKRLVNQSRHYRLQAGRDLKEHPAMVTSLLDPLLTSPLSAA